MLTPRLKAGLKLERFVNFECCYMLKSLRRTAAMFKEFKKFILRGNVVDLAVAVVVGTAFNALVQALVKDLFTPLIAALGGQHDVSELTFQIHGSTFMYGDVINVLISFLSIAAVVFFFVVQPLNRLMTRLKPSEEVDSPAERECPECLSAIPAAAKRCKFCTAKSTPTKNAAK
jgi:large conductance mechanosensitive channel